MPYPIGYEWLGRIGTLPKMVTEALADVGTLETPGAGNNPVIMGWADYVGVEAIGWKYTADSIPHCGLAMAAWVKRAGKPLPFGPLYALNWGAFGSEAHQPILGDVLTFVRTGGGHVGQYIGEDPTAFHILAANQGGVTDKGKVPADGVTIARIDKKRLYRVRRAPFKIGLPPSARPYILSAGGAPLNVNEA